MFLFVLLCGEQIIVCVSLRLINLSRFSPLFGSGLAHYGYYFDSFWLCRHHNQIK